MKDKKYNVLLVLQIMLGISVICISIYSLSTNNFSLQPLTLLLMSAMMLIIGLREHKRRILLGIFFYCIALFIGFVAFQSLIVY
ncbi:MAG TPA: DUF3953 domain-containing protein [Ureibacillus sp.]|nr:DUF3953 domain-containing protein [Ureibacillus sp.]